MANYPNSVPSFATKNAGDVIQPSHVNTLGDEVTAIGNGLLNGVSHVLPVNAGVQFPATQAASANVNTLDDYEEGTFSFTDQSGAGLTIGGGGVYVKVGKLVTVQGQILFPATANGLAAVIGGLPFTSPSNSALAVGFSDIDLRLDIPAASTTIVPRSPANVQQSNGAISGANIVFSGLYLAAS